jgi:hypothetical protein
MDLPFNTASIEFQSLWNVNNDHSHLVLRYEGTGYTSGSYPGSQFQIHIINMHT